MDCRTPGFPVLHYLPELAQIHVHSVGDAIYHIPPMGNIPSCTNQFSKGLLEYNQLTDKICGALPIVGEDS